MNFRLVSMSVMLFGAIKLSRSAFVAPRYVPLVKYQVVSGDDGIGKECPGF